MKLRSLFVFGAGVLAGLAIARKMTEDDPQILHGPSDAKSAGPARRAVSSGSQKLADKAGVASLEAIRKARGKIKERLGDEGYEDAAWS